MQLIKSPEKILQPKKESLQKKKDMQKLLLLVPLNFLLILDAYDYYFQVFFKTHIIIQKNRDSTPTLSLVK